MKVSEIYKAFQMLFEARTPGIEPAEVVNIIKIMGVFRPVCDEFENFRKDLFDKYGIPNFEETVRALRMGESLTEEQKHELDVYESQAAPILDAELERVLEKDLDYPRITPETMARLIQANGWKMSASIELSFLIA